MEKPDDVLRLISIDPSTSHMGVCVIDVNIKEDKPFDLVYVNTIHGDRVNFGVPYAFDDNGKAQSRIFGLVRAYKELISIYEPNFSICEDNFLGLDPSAYKRLIEVVSHLKMASYTHANLSMFFVLPNLAKAIVGANFRGTKKEDVAKGILGYPDLNLGEYDINALDDHSTDAIVIGLYLAEKVAEEYRPLKK